MTHFQARVLAGGRVRVLHGHADDPATARADFARHGRVISIQREREGWFATNLGRSERYILMIRLAALIESKVGMAEALRRLGEVFRGRVRRVAERLVDAIETGDDLATAFERLPLAFPAAVVALVRAGCAGGSTPKALRDAAAFEQEVAEIERQSSLALVSALANFFLAAAIMIATTHYINPLLLNTALFHAADVAARVGTGGDATLIMTLANLATLVVIVLSVLLLGLIAVATLGRRLAPELSDRLITGIPIYRPIARGRDTFITLYKMSLLIRSGVAIDRVLALVAESGPPGAMRRDLTTARARVKTGQPWPEALKMLPAIERASLVAAEDRVEIARILNAMALQYKDLYIHGLAVMVPGLKAVSIIFLGIAALVLFGLTVLPMFQLTNFMTR